MGTWGKSNSRLCKRKIEVDSVVLIVAVMEKMICGADDESSVG